MSDLPDEVMDRAVEAVDNDPVAQGVAGWDDQVEAVIRAAAPVLIKAEREGIRARIQGVADRLDEERRTYEQTRHAELVVEVKRELKGVRSALSAIDEGKEA